jgi:hypothetical protein
MDVNCIYFPKAGWRMAFIIGVFFQWLSPNGMVLLPLPMYHNSSWYRYKFMGERLRVLADTVRGAVILVSGVTTLGSCDKSRDPLTWAGIVFTCICDLV